MNDTTYKLQPLRSEIFFTVKETADYLRLSEKQVRRHISRGELPAHQFGTALRIHKQDRVGFIKARRVIPANKKK